MAGEGREGLPPLGAPPPDWAPAWQEAHRLRWAGAAPGCESTGAPAPAVAPMATWDAARREAGFPESAEEAFRFLLDLAAGTATPAAAGSSPSPSPTAYLESCKVIAELLLVEAAGNQELAIRVPLLVHTHCRLCGGLNFLGSTGDRPQGEGAVASGRVAFSGAREAIVRSFAEGLPRAARWLRGRDQGIGVPHAIAHLLKLLGPGGGPGAGDVLDLAVDVLSAFGKVAQGGNVLTKSSVLDFSELDPMPLHPGLMAAALERVGDSSASGGRAHDLLSEEDLAAAVSAVGTFANPTIGKASWNKLHRLYRHRPYGLVGFCCAMFLHSLEFCPSKAVVTQACRAVQAALAPLPSIAADFQDHIHGVFAKVLVSKISPGSGAAGPVLATLNLVAQIPAEDTAEPDRAGQALETLAAATVEAAGQYLKACGSMPKQPSEKRVRAAGGLSAELSPCIRHCKDELRELVEGDDENEDCSGDLSDAHARFVQAGDFLTSFALFLHKFGLSAKPYIEDLVEVSMLCNQFLVRQSMRAKAVDQADRSGTGARLVQKTIRQVERFNASIGAALKAGPAKSPAGSAKKAMPSAEKRKIPGSVSKTKKNKKKGRSENAYINAVLAYEADAADDLDDLADFIVCKAGRDYDKVLDRRRSTC